MTEPFIIIGGGPAGLMAATTLIEAGQAVHLYERMPSVGRKFLMAGKGGLNLTHSEKRERFVERYGKEQERFSNYLKDFGPEEMVALANRLGIETFVGTSGRVFPKDFKAAPLLRSWVRHLRKLGVVFHVRHRWTGFDDLGQATFEHLGETITAKGAATLLAFGGASWPKFGSDGSWVSILESKGVNIAPLRPSNCGFLVSWSERLTTKHEGAPLKNIALSFGDQQIKGEMVLSSYGIEGTPVYALSGPMRDTIEVEGQAVLNIDLKPGLSLEQITTRLSKPRGKASLTNFLRKALKLTPPAISLLMEATTPEERAEKATLAKAIKELPLTLTGTRPIEEAISSAGGIHFDALDDTLMIKALPSIFAAGEMLDWEAPTGGYLLQGCFATGVRAAKGMLASTNP